MQKPKTVRKNISEKTFSEKKSFTHCLQIMSQEKDFVFTVLGGASLSLSFSLVKSD